MESSCLIALLLVITGNILEAITASKTFLNRNHEFSMQNWQDLDPDYIKQNFEYRLSFLGLTNVASMMNALALFAVFIPMLQVSWILTNGGKRRLASHTAICALALAGGLCELIVNLMMIGIHNVVAWLVSSFKLDDWSEEGDGTGWRVLEVVSMTIRGKWIQYDTRCLYCNHCSCLMRAFVNSNTATRPNRNRQE